MILSNISDDNNSAHVFCDSIIVSEKLVQKLIVAFNTLMQEKAAQVKLSNTDKKK